MNKEQFYNHYNPSMSVAGNITKFQNQGYKISKSTVYRYLKEDNLSKGHSVSNRKDNNNIGINICNDTEDPTTDNVLDCIRQDQTVTIPEIAREIGVSEKNAKRRIAKLKSGGGLIREEDGGRVVWKLMMV